ncbi:MAG: class I SAM-dependent methyltransferase [Rubrivivax sp.]|nr:class I SAM-dependent methyltransferase [Rubrivivax sp.]
MTDWTAGYVADVGYTHGYYPELNPLRVAHAFAAAGVVCPRIATACELGYGQGLSANLHAAASGVQWHGTDFNPAHAAFARDLADASGAGAQLHGDAFADYARRTDLPDFDFIGLHGVWSWISDENRACIVDFIDRKLKVGGALYVSYNTLPGWATFGPMRHLMTQHAAVMGTPGAALGQRIDGALAFAEALLAADPQFGRAHPAVRERLAHFRGQSRAYLAHEFFNRDWLPMHFADMAGCLSQARLTYVGSAHPLDAVDALSLSEAQRALLSTIPDPMFRETVRDFMTHQQFRRDHWVKGPRRLDTREQTALLRAQRVLLVTPRAEVPLTLKAPVGEAELSDPAYATLLDALADRTPRTLGELADAAPLPIGRVAACINVLVGMTHVVPVQDEAAVQAAGPTSAALNVRLRALASGGGEVGHLASPLVGGGVPVSRISQLFVSSVGQGRTRPEDWAHDAWDELQAQASRLVKDGRTIESDDDNLAELTRLAGVFAERELPLLRTLGVA